MSLPLKNKLLNQHLENLSKTENLKQVLKDSAAELADVPKIVIRKIALMKLLKGIPFHYLVPHPDMLPQESIKFFYLDANWINALIDGVYSIGRYAAHADEGDGTPANLSTAMDQLFAQRLHESSDSGAKRHRNYLLYRHGDYHPPHKKLSFDEEPNEESTLISGFLLRSKAVNQWKDLLATAYDKPVTEGDVSIRKIYRFERIEEDLLLCLFQGDFEQLDIHEPAQAIHFGFDENGPGNYEKILRTSDAQRKIDTPASVPFRDTETKVLKMSELSLNMAKVLSDAGDNKPPYLGGNITRLLASDFAFQMVKGVGMVQFFKDKNT